MKVGGSGLPPTVGDMGLVLSLLAHIAGSGKPRKLPFLFIMCKMDLNVSCIMYHVSSFDISCDLSDLSHHSKVIMAIMLKVVIEDWCVLKKWVRG